MARSEGAPWRRGWGVGSGLVGLYWKGVLTGELFTISRTRLPWEGGSPSGVSQAPDVKTSEHRQYKISEYTCKVNAQR